MRKLSFLLLSFLFAGAVAQAAPPRRVDITYELRRDGSVLAEVNNLLEHDGNRYRLSETWKGKGIYGLRGEATRASRGTIGPAGLRPEEFEDLRPGKDPRRARPAAGAQDRLSVLWHFAFNPPTVAVTLQVADGRGVATHVYEPVGRERVSTPAGDFNALKLLRKDNERGAQVWLATDKGGVPVRMLMKEKDGTTIEVVAKRISQ